MKLNNNIKDNFIKYNSKHKFLIERVEDAINNEWVFNSFKVLRFVNYVEKDIIKQYLNQIDNIDCDFQTSFTNSELSLCIIGNKEVLKNNRFTSLVSIKYNRKFNSISHKDILGSILSLKIDRQLIGDIYCSEELDYFECNKEIANYIINNMTKIKNTKVVLQEVDDLITKDIKFKEQQAFVSSLRLDLVVKHICNISREQAKELILQELVKVNYYENTNFSYNVCNQDLISIRKYGRFIIDLENIRYSKKDKIVLKWKKYI